ncbi:hypothetical protein TTHERM_000149349 (macronuclear) [Tetrahymena thermophila SB210]|uniref:Uncharacterized protein n=1 Tax=Tetrahymena thermophila (strain SB210) TaxID=312017 RepID=W7X9F2_TETTS|nr:hypothetical protein TTHERM_000149349 [Tetrahymena thermophila SB210]EWS73023.1 hypothetical protein TTHERM_000149349 [Tetrahymena thermophila SB210]|eukprot:XP_012654420.1 hypothetical protein TTHERM_000149349 [Tetrahymena thermophila SB210]
MLEIKKGIGGEESQSIKAQFRNLSPITLNQQHQSQSRSLQKSHSPLRENNIGNFDIKINKITNPLYNVGVGNQLIIDQSPQQMNKKLINIFETRQFQKNISAQEYRQQKDDASSYSPSVPNKMNKNEMKRVLIRQGLQGNLNQQFQNKPHGIKLSEKDNLNQIKALNQSIDLSILPKGNTIQEEISFKSHREKNVILPSSNIKTMTKNLESNDNQRVFCRKKEFNDTQKINVPHNNNNINNISSKKLNTHESSISCDVSNNNPTQNQIAQLQNITDFNKAKTHQSNQTKVAIQFEQVIPSYYQENENKRQLQKVFSKTKTQFENFSDQFIKKPQAGQGVESNNQLKNQIQNYRNKTQKQSLSQREDSNTLDYELKEQFIQKQKQDSKDFLPLHLKILEEYQNDTLIKKDPSPQLPNCQITIQKTQLAKKYQLFLRNQKNKTIIAQKSSLTPQKLPYTKLIQNESNGIIFPTDKLPDIKQNSISEKVGEIFDSNRRDSVDKLELNLQIRKLDTDVDPQKAKKQKSKSVHQNTQIKFQKQKFCNNAERFYRLFAKNQMNNNRLYTEQLNTSQNNYSQINQNNLYSDEFNDTHIEDVSASNGLVQELSTASVLDAKNVSELNIHRLLEKQKNKKLQNLQISSPNLFPNQNLQQNKSQVSQINILNDEEKPNKIQMNERNSQKLIQFLQLQPQQQKQQYFQQNQIAAQQRQQYNFSNSQADQYQNHENNQQVSQSANSQHYDYGQLYFSKDGNISIPIQSNQQEYNFNKKILRLRNQSGVSQNTNKQSPRRAIQVSRLDLSSNVRDQVYYSLNTSENYMMNQNQDYSIPNDEQIQNSQQNEFSNIVINISKTMNTMQNQNQQQLHEISKSLVHQSPQPIQKQSKESDNSFLQHMYFNRNLNAFRRKKKSNQQNHEIQITETGFGDDNLNQQSILNGFSIEDYVSEMKSEQKSQIKTDKNQRKKK